MTQTAQQIATQTGLSLTDIEAMLTFAPVTVAPLHTDDAIAQRQTELAAERQAHAMSDDAIRALLIDTTPNA